MFHVNYLPLFPGLNKSKKPALPRNNRASKYAPKLVTNIAALENLFESDLFASVAKTWLNADRFRLTMLKNSQSEDSGLAASAVTC